MAHFWITRGASDHAARAASQFHKICATVIKAVLRIFCVLFVALITFAMSRYKSLLKAPKKAFYIKFDNNNNNKKGNCPLEE
jgi:hypothetical protein